MNTMQIQFWIWMGVAAAPEWRTRMAHHEMFAIKKKPGTKAGLNSLGEDAFKACTTNALVDAIVQVRKAHLELRILQQLTKFT